MKALKQYSPEELNSMFIAACESQTNGDLKKAEVLYLELLSNVQAPLLHYNLGLVYYDLCQYPKARDHFQTAAKGDPEDCDSLFNLALSFKACSQLDNAIQTYLQVLGHEPDNIDAWYNLASCYREIRDDTKAIEYYEQVLKRKPDHISAINNIAYMYHLTDNTDKAIFYYRKVLQHNPDHDAARHMLSAIEGTTAESSPESYIRDVFDNYSDHYEKSLVDQLHYTVPQQLRKEFDKIFGTDKIFHHGIDLGCGTGLSGVAFANRIGIFEGIDLSKKMIDIARKKAIYSSLFTGSIDSHLSVSNKSYDFFLAADVLNYIGNLDELFSLVSQRASANAIFCFSTEKADGDSFILRATGRFAHSQVYVDAIAKKAGWSVTLQCATNLRMDKGEWITGALWILQKK